MKGLYMILLGEVSFTAMGQTTNTFPLDGNVGIGTMSPNVPFHVAKYGNNVTGGMTLLTSFTDPTGIKGVSLGYNQYSQAGIIYSENNTGVGSPLEFWTYNGSSFAPRMVFTQGGNLGIGVQTPKAKLDVNGNILISSANIPMGLITELAGTTTPLLNMSANFREENKNDAYVGGGFRIDTRGEEVGAPLFQWISRKANSNIESVEMSLTSTGYLGIGTLAPRERLSVNGKIRAHEIKVETTNWPDYVFAKDYQLQTLQETERHIKDKGHLPGIPSAADVKANGVDLGKMNAKLLQKIEELTLHLIEMKKENQQLRVEVNKIKTKIK